ncbi:P22 coat protein-gene protein 5 [Pseudomonas sp. NFPP05]|uniref:P22 phage major capsid protein family protein n=1 Tax=unclassified Pseudomonas TaxID=196821 RepID=UPI00088177AB|nr:MULTISPECIES: P22 phage major capsid protein family protein [unclassified Pseudomonas]SDA11178.1 P22 coat protein-gene protein 5 [Pseudomonas sp. NFPP12]SFM12245.1 P22 coat protein-gene protein 5 [Pseudomonas sp. NFPP05]
MAALTAGKIAEVMFGNALDTYEPQDMLLPTTTFFEPDGSTMQNSGNTIWRPVQQHRPVLTGFDLAGQEQGIIEETYPAFLGTPTNDFVSQRADDMRDMRFWEKAGMEAGRQQATNLNKAIATAIGTQGAMFYRTNVTSGYDVVGEAQTLMNERQGAKSDRYFLFNDRDNLKYSKDLAARQTVQGRPETTWATGQIGQNIAEFDVYTASFLPNLIGGADPATTVTANQSFAPTAGTVNSTNGTVTNVDYRYATIPVTASASYNIGDKVTIANGGVTIKALGLADKSDTGVAMTFTVTGKPSGTSLVISPKPVALDDPALSALEAAYANVNTRILNTATVNRVNTDTSKKTNLFYDKDAVEVLGGTIPAELFKSFDGLKVINQTMKNGLKMYMIYDANMVNLQFRYRLFTWWGVTIKDPSRCGVAVTF